MATRARVTAGLGPGPRRPGRRPAPPATWPPGQRSAGTPPHGAFGGQRGLATGTPAPPPLIGRLGTDPQPLRDLHRADIVLIHSRGLQPHALTPGPPSSGRATTIWVPHISRRSPPPGAITQARRT